MRTASSPALVIRGRDVELAAIGGQLDRARSGVGAVVLLEGGAGMGKTRLLAEAERMARRLSFRVVTGGGDPGERVVEMSALMGALGDGPHSLIDVSVLRDLGATTEQRYWLLHDLGRLLERAAGKGPILVALDDVHWADQGTASGLRTLPSRLREAPIMWMFAFRANEGSAEIRRAVKDLQREGAERLVLEPLPEEAVAQVARDVMQAEPEASVLEIARGARGSPFVLVELLSGLRQEGLCG